MRKKCNIGRNYKTIHIQLNRNRKSIYIYIYIISLDTKRLNYPMKRPMVFETHDNLKDTYSLKMKEWEKLYFIHW